MIKTDLRLVQVPIPTLAALMEACAEKPTSEVEDLADFAGFSTVTAKRALASLETLGIVERNEDGAYHVAVEGVRRGMGLQAASLVIRKALQGFRPFELLCEGLALGEDAQTAMRKTARLLDLDDRERDRLQILLRWGEDLSVLESDENGITLASELQPSALPEESMLQAGDLESEAKARLYNAKHLGRAANNYLDEIDRQLLAEALLGYEENPRKSVDDSGQAFEDFLREVAKDNSLDAEAKTKNGAGQLANLLYTHQVIHSHHQKLGDAISTMRNATAHRKDKKTLTPWEITPLGAFAAHTLALAAIRSIHEFTTTRKQTL